MLIQWNKVKEISLYMLMGLSAGFAVGGFIVGGSHLLSSRTVSSLQAWNGYPMNTVDWFGVLPPLVGQIETPQASSSISAPSFKLLGTSLFSSEKWVLLTAEQPDGSAQWVREDGEYGAYRVHRIQARSATFVAKEGEGEWTLSLSSDASNGMGIEGEKQDCLGVIRVPRMAMDVLNQQQVVLMQGVETISDGKGGIRVKPELAALLGGLGFMAGDSIIEANGQPLREPHALLGLVVNPLLQGRTITIKGLRGSVEKQWRLINETACK